MRKLLEGGFPNMWVTGIIEEHALEGRRKATVSINSISRNLAFLEYKQNCSALLKQ